MPSREIYPDVVPNLRKLKRKYKLVLLSDTTLGGATFALDQLKLREYFDDVLLSCDTGFLKVDIEPFKMIMKKLNI